MAKPIVLIWLIFIQFLVSPNWVLSQQDPFQEGDLTPFFNVTISVPSNNPERIEIINHIIEELAKIGIHADLHIDNLQQIAERSVYNFKDPVPLFENDGYDIYSIGFISDEKVTWKHFGYMNRNLLSSFGDTIGGINSRHTNYQSSEFWMYMENYFHELNSSKRMNWFSDIQDVLANDIPLVGLYTNPLLIMQSPDIDLSSNAVRSILDQATPSNLANLQTTNPDDTITLYFNQNVDPSQVSELNPLYESDTLLQMIFQPLYETELNDPLTWKPLLAKSLPIWNTNQTIARVEIRDDIYFSDGEHFDAYDVNDTYAWYIDNQSGNNIENFQLELFKYMNVSNPVRIIDNYTIDFHFSEPYIHAMNLLNQEIIPSHILGKSTYTIQENIDDAIFRDLLENGTTDLLIGTGPYEFSSFNYNDTNYSLEFVPNSIYWNGEVKTGKIVFEYFFPRSNFPELVAKGDIDLAILRSEFPPTQFNTSTFDNVLGLSYFRLPASYIQFLGFNMYHPIYGNGSQTPLGLQNPSRQEEAARYVRQAINTAIPRNTLLEDIFGEKVDLSHYKPVKSHFLPTVHGYKAFNDLYEFNIDKAKLLMENAGYKFPPTNMTPSDSGLNNSVTDDVKFPYRTLIIVGVIIGLKKVKRLEQRFHLEKR